MAFTPLDEGMHDAEWLYSEEPGHRSFDEIAVVYTSAGLPAGTVLGGALTTKAATLHGGTVAETYNPSAVSGGATVLGVLRNGLPAGSGAGYAASGRITFSNQPGDDSTITLNGAALTFKASGASGEQEVNKGGTLAATLTAAAAKLNAATTTTAWTGATYYATATTLEIVYDTTGSGGNAYTVVAGSGSNGTALAATLIGGGYIAKAAVATRDCVAIKANLNWFASASDAQKLVGLTALTALGIICRDTPDDIVVTP